MEAKDRSFVKGNKGWEWVAGVSKPKPVVSTASPSKKKSRTTKGD